MNAITVFEILFFHEWKWKVSVVKYNCLSSKKSFPAATTTSRVQTDNKTDKRVISFTARGHYSWPHLVLFTFYTVDFVKSLKLNKGMKKATLHLFCYVENLTPPEVTCYSCLTEQYH